VEAEVDLNRGSMVAMLVGQLLVTGCGFYDAIPVDTIFIDKTFSEPIPYMNGDVERIARVRCKLTPLVQGALFRGTCEAALSNGVSDLANDLHTGIDFLDAFAEGDLEARLQEEAGLACGDYINQQGIPALIWQAAVRGNEVGWPGLGQTVADYINRHAVGFRAYAWCFEAVERAWDETNDNTYSGGHRCAVGRATITVRDLDHPPEISLGTFPRDESNVLCPHARIVMDIPGPFNPYWGND